ncbi:hypothetical protein PBI_GAIA_47 [Mycobacterium phage Gaia]|uniref:Uncharacterized protein n=1 Tax=Mycobacterium phage Gaia TaxID=1486472 RepID=A0A068F1P5_9CAUD|nr:hypothetical protein VC46_gp047 [Mycobacterium phage Gaia]AID58867.1 hypothetical protein PBI_GAIA_47 [Mycobacterium phage Gaia]AYQ99991.1 hypothetical protein PBI_NEBKISS_50 [Mycobacterium phage Nebkiss]
MSDIVDRARELLAGIDPYRPWDVEPLPQGWGVYAADSQKALCRSPREAEFIAAAPELVSELLAENERLRAELDELKEAHRLHVRDKSASRIWSEAVDEAREESVDRERRMFRIRKLLRKTDR